MKSDNQICRILAEFGLPPDYADIRGLVPYAEANDLINIGLNPFGMPVHLEPEAGKAWYRMHDSAAEDKIILYPLSGFRSIALQTEIIRNKLNQGWTIEDIMKANAPPGYSQHHSGKALDICTDSVKTPDVAFEKTKAFKWLITYASLFGFILSYPKDNPFGFIYEPWHWYFNKNV
jgi:D-alanyl-D-alanine carboxypeptidase